MKKIISASPQPIVMILLSSAFVHSSAAQDELFSAFQFAFAPHPPAPFSHKGRRGILGVLMPETREGAG